MVSGHSPARSEGVARDGDDVGAAARALASQVHPVFMLPPLATSLFGAALAGRFDPPTAVVHVVAVFAAVYTAHVKDGYVDFHARGEDDDHPLTRRGCRLALGAATVAFAAATATLLVRAGPVAAALTAPTWLIGYLHAPQLDTTTVGATAGYPVGIGLALLGGYATQTGAVAPTPLAFAAVFVVLLTGVKIVDDGTDYDYDRGIDKPTVAVVLGRRRARQWGFRLLGAAMVGVLWFTVDGLFPPAAALAPLALAAVAPFAARAADDVATMLLVRACYLFLAVLVVAVWFRPLAGVSLPDIGVLGPYTYLATEVVFGALALALLVRTDAVRSAARTVAALYPLAYVWDWYTLEVGVFAIPLRTGVELAGIPVEEHLFMLVVPALVVGVHETLRNREPASPTTTETARQED
ncbi:MAG: lycopene cyclase domain-containing protein [Halolamina sp.]